MLNLDIPAAVVLAQALDRTLPAWAALALITAIAEGVAQAMRKQSEAGPL